MFVIQTVSMTTDRLQNQLLIQVNVKISTRKVMENRSNDLKIKSFASKSKHVLSHFRVPGQRHSGMSRDRVVQEYSSLHQSRRTNYPSYRSALKWVRDNKDTIETLVELLQIHPDLLKNKVLENFLNFLRTYKIQTQSKTDRLFNDFEKTKNFNEVVPTITVTSEAYTRSNKITPRLLILGKRTFESDNGLCGDLLSELSHYFSVHSCDANNDILSEIPNVEACLFLLSESSLAQSDTLALIQQVKLTNVPVLFIRTPNLTIPEHANRERSLSSCSAHGTERCSPISLPLPPISRTPNYLNIDSNFIFDNIYSIQDVCKNAIEYMHGDLSRCLRQITAYFNVKTQTTVYKTDAFEQLNMRANSLSIKQNSTARHDNQSAKQQHSIQHCTSSPSQHQNSLSMQVSLPAKDDLPSIRVNSSPIQDKHVHVNEKTEVDSSAVLTYEDTLGASLIVMEHMTYGNLDPNDITIKLKNRYRSNNASKTTLELPMVSTCKTPPLSPVFRKREKRKKNANFSPTRDNNSDYTGTFDIPESPIDSTTYLLFSKNKGEIPATIVNWPKDAKSMPINDDSMSEDSSISGFQDVDFTSSLWPCNSDEDNLD
ncbi:unnamed protein product [Mytilus coruscus]|uniref:Uncharacterized protein n=1 Tax=Mytilus coruscus TaxID=42192 RepID=A0A6J8EDF0_MYTCO|nr:unnamed protein product [Mytilus coruscus]